MGRAGERLLDAQLMATRSTLELVDDAAAATVGHLEAGRAVVAPFPYQDYAVGDVVGVMVIGETTGQERVGFAEVSVVEIRGQGVAAWTATANGIWALAARLAACPLIFG